MQFSRELISYLLNDLNIKTNGKLGSNGWQNILCPNHNDHNYGSAYISTSSGVLFCFACGFSKNIINIYKEAKGFATYNEAVASLKSVIPLGIITTDFVPRIHEARPSKFRRVEPTGILLDIKDPEKFFYLKQRGISKRFIDAYGIKHCLGGSQYEDYMLIPIQDSRKGIQVFEARKFMSKEYLEKFFEVTITTQEEVTRFAKEFSLLKDSGAFTVDFGKVSYKTPEDRIRFFPKETLIRYLVKKKVLYPPNTPVNETIWNIDDLIEEDTLYVCEGIGSICRLMLAFETTNVTCTFGSRLSNDQAKILSRFNNIILLSDNDDASKGWIESIGKVGKSVSILNTEAEDIDPDFEKKVRECERIPFNKFILKNFFHP